jgi:Domain of unknown function (DUF4864)
MLRRLLLLLAMLFAAALPLRAEPPSAADTAEFQRIIAAQIAAFNADDGNTAYGFAAPMIQQSFPAPDAFMAMVRQGYPQVYRQRSFGFEEAITDNAGRPGQKVRIVDLAGKTWIALYSMEKQADGTWRISGCYILQAPGVDA